MSGQSDGHSILREAAWTSLVQRLDALAAADPTMAAARDTLLRPLRLLQMLAIEAGGALGQDVLAAERMRNLLYLASPWSSLVAEAEQLLKEPNQDPPAHAAGVIDLRVLTLVAIAAVRVAPTTQLAHMFLRAVHGLALSATPAEMLGEMEPYGHDSGALREVVKLMVLPETGRLRDNRLFLPRFALDPMTRGRWLCLRKVLTAGIQANIDTVWAPAAQQHASHADLIQSIRPVDAKPGDELTIAGRFGTIVTSNKWPKALHVVFASAAGSQLEAEVLSFSADTIKVRVPDGAASGWIGLIDDRLKAAANQNRRAVRKVLAKVGSSGAAFGSSLGASTATAGCFDGALPSSWVPDLDALPVPPRTAANRYAGTNSSRAGFTFNGNVPHAFAVRSSALVLFRPAIVEDEGARVEVGGMHRAGLSLLASHGLGLRAAELPWVDDPLAVLSTTVRSQDDPRIARLLDHLSRAALNTPGLEHALWLMLVPGTTTLAVSKPAEAAAAVAIATVSGLPILFEELARSAWRPVERTAMQRLRVGGRLARGGELRVLGSRLETAPRFVGPGAPVDSGFVAVAVDGAGHDLHSQAITCLSAERPSEFGLLFPITPEVAVVELRNRRQMVYAIRRSDGSPDVTGPRQPGDKQPRPLRVRNDVLRWQYHHPFGLRSETTVEVSRDELWTPFTPLDGCRGEETIPLHRLADVKQVRIVASDGWNAAEKVVEGKVNGRAAVIARRVNDVQWWADVGPGWSVAWHVPGLPTQDTKLVDVPPDTTGTLRLVATHDESGETVVDERSLEREDLA